MGQPVPPGEHWSATARLTLDHAAGWQQAGLALYADDENFMRLTFSRSGGGPSEGQRFFELVTVRDGEREQTAQANLSADHPDTVLVRLTRAGDEIVARFATSAVRFDANAGAWLPRDQGSLNAFHGSTDRSVEGLTGPEVRIGPYAGGGVEQGPNPTAGFDYVQVGPDAARCAGDDGWHDLRARARPAIRNVGPKRKRVAYRFQITNVGAGPSGVVRLCATAPSKRLRIVGSRCKAYPSIDPGQTRKRAVRVRVKPRAKGKMTRIDLIARGPAIDRVRARVRLRVRR